MIWLILTISTAWTLTCAIAGVQVRKAMARKRATMRLGELMRVGEHWIQLDPDKAVLGPSWMN